MREEKLFRAIGDVGDDLIARADEPVQKKKPVRWAGIAALAACCLIAVGLARLVTLGMGNTSDSTAALDAAAPETAMMQATEDAKSGSAENGAWKQESADEAMDAAANDAEAPAETEEGYSGQLRDIRRANDRIADPAISAKIDRLEDLAGKIFRIVEEEPAKKAKASTFLNYYLPTTQKLLDSYADFEEAGVSGGNGSQAKQRIADTMDKIVAGFERQLDELYRADAMDIDSDIRVMETMLRRDSATVADDFGLGGTAVQQQDE